MKPWLIIFLSMVMISHVMAINVNVTEFDDGCASCSITSNSTKYVTLTTDATVNNATMDISGTKTFELVAGYEINRSITWLEIQDISLIPDGGGDFYATDKTNRIYRLNSSGAQLGNYSTNSTCNSGLLLPFTEHRYFGIHAVDNDTVYVVHKDSSADDESLLVKVNYTSHECIDWWWFSIKETINDAEGVYVDDNMDYAYITDTDINEYIFKLNIKNCTPNDGITGCKWDDNDWTSSKTSVPRPYVALDSPDNGTTLYALYSILDDVYILNSTFDSQGYYSLDYTAVYGFGLSPVGLTMNGSDFWIADESSTDEIDKLLLTFPQNVKVYTNDTEVFSIAELNSTTINIDLNASIIESYIVNDAVVPFMFNASNFGSWSLSNIFFNYNKSFVAILKIISPSQISATVSSGSDYSVDIIISNTGNYNASNISMETVSASSSPNLNDSISHNCSSIIITNGTNSTCNVYFSNITQSAESDERLKINGVGTEDNETVFSNSIDVDIIVPTVVSGGGGGGGGTQAIEGMIIIEPFLKKFVWAGSEGDTRRGIIRVYNNASSIQLVTFMFDENLRDICTYSIDTFDVPGKSELKNSVTCTLPGKDFEAKMVLLYGSGGSDSIKVLVTESRFGAVLEALSGIVSGESGAVALSLLIFVPIGIIIMIMIIKGR